MIAVYLENAGHGGRNAAPLAGSVLDFFFADQIDDAGRGEDGPRDATMSTGGYSSPTSKGGAR